MKKSFVLLFAVVCSTFVFGKVDFLRVMFNHNGDDRATIGWNQVSGDSAVVFWGTEDIPSSRYLEYSNIAHVTTSNIYKGMNNNFVRLVQLRPNTAYYFVIKDSEGISSRYWFRTTPNNEDARLSFVAGGDSRSRRETRRHGFRMVGRLVPHAILFDGDYTDIDTEEKWKLWFEDYKLTYQESDNRIIPIVTTRGNHEGSNKCLTEMFDCPSEHNLYNVTMGGTLVNIICLNTEIAIGYRQKKFLEETLREYERFSWQIPMYHRSCRPHVNWKMKMRQVKLIYRKWIHLFEKYGVKFVLECDSHITKHTWPIVKCKGKQGEDGFIRDDENGIVYAGEGCWGAPLRVPDRIRSWTRDAGSINSFKWIFLDKNELSFRTVDYMNSKEVEHLTDETRFELPKNINIWSPKNGDKVVIKK
ncbi:MAG: metallophosphoesterase [Crocinitomicaceae bacterium]|nr:metallophosphoesterase [Crocinitomicaceae bacterium]